MSDTRASQPSSHSLNAMNGSSGADLVAEHRGHDAEELSLRELIQVLRRRLLVILAVIAVAVAITGYVVFREIPTYRAEAVIRLQDARQAMTGGLDVQQVQPILGLRARMVDPLASHLEVMTSRGVLGSVVDVIGLRLVSSTPGLSLGHLSDVLVAPDAPTDTLQLRFLEKGAVLRHGAGEVRAPYGAPLAFPGGTFTIPVRPDIDEGVFVVDERQRVIDRLAEAIQAVPREATDVFDVSYVADHARLAQRVVNATVQEFRRQNVQAARQQSIRRRVFVEEQLSATDSMLTQAQRTLSEFRRRERVFSSSEWFAAHQTGLMELDARRADVGAQKQVYQSILDGIREADLGEASRRLQALAASPEIAENPVISGLHQQLAELELARDSLISGPWARARTNPDVTRIEVQVSTVTERLEGAARSHLASLDARQAALDSLRAQLVAEMELLPEAQAEESRLVLQVETIHRMADLLREEQQRARIAEAIEEGQVQIVDLAAVPLDPVGTMRALRLVLGLMLGAILGFGLAFLREKLDTAIRRREEIEGLLRVPGLGVVPRIGPARSRRRWRVLPRAPARLGPAAASKAGAAVAKRWSAAAETYRVAASRGLSAPETLNSLKAFLSVRPETTQNGTNGKNGKGARKRKSVMPVADGRSAAAEAYRTVRTGLLFSEALHSLRTLLITSPSPAEGKTTTAANLAITFAEQGKRVLLIDADLRRPRLHNVFHIPRDPGLTQLVVGQAAFADVIRETDYGLHILPAGLLPPNPAELLGGERMRKALAHLRDSYEFVIIDAAPLLLAADAAVLAAQVDGSLLVLRAGKTGREDGVQALHQLTSIDARVVGAVLNDPDGSLARLGGYYRYAYRYSGYYAED